MGLFSRTPARRTTYASPEHERLPALTASARVVTKAEVGTLKRLSQPWQRRALAYYDMAPEARFAANYQGNALSQIRLYPAFMDGNERKETDDEKAVALLNRIHDPNSVESTEIKRSFGRLMALTGEGYLLCTGTGQEDEPEKWEFVSNEELRVEADGRLRRFTAPGGAGTVYEFPDDLTEDEAFEPLDANEAVAYRMWRPSPKHSGLADSPMQSVLDLFEELILLQMAVRSRVRSRLSAAGLMLIAESVTLPALDGAAANDDPREDPLLTRMIAHMMAPIRDEGSASGVVPFMLRTPLEEGQKIGDLISHIRFSDPNETYRETGLRKECIERIATGMDIPAEILLGLGDLNHWNAWQVDEQVAKAHIFPTAALLCSNLTQSYLRPAARDEGLDNWENLIVWYDPAELVVHPDKSGNARELWDRGELGPEALRDAHGFTEDDAPSEEEIVKWFAIQKKDVGLYTTGEATPQAPPTIPGAPPANGPQNGDGVILAKQAPPEPAAATVTAAVVSGGRANLILGAAEMALTRAREMAGSRVRGRARSCEECLEGTEDVDNGALVAALGVDRVARLGAPGADDLVAGAGKSLAATLTRFGVSEEWADTLAAEVEAHAARTLFDADATLPPQFLTLTSRAERA